MKQTKFLVYRIGTDDYRVYIYTHEYRFTFYFNMGKFNYSEIINNIYKDSIKAWKHDKGHYHNVPQLKGSKRYKFITECKVLLEDAALVIHQYLTT